MRLDLYERAHRLKNSVPFLWDVAGRFNKRLFILRYGDRLPNAIQSTETALSAYMTAIP